jgi:hypothetical protein
MSRHDHVSVGAASEGNEPPLPGLREPDHSSLALWSALFMASSAVFAFFAMEPVHAGFAATPAMVSSSGVQQGAAAKRLDSAVRRGEGSEADSWH